MATGRTCRTLIATGLSPLAAAVRMKSSPRISFISARVIRMQTAASGRPAAIHGTSSEWSHLSGFSKNGT